MAYVESDSYTTQSHVESLAKHGPFTASTEPSKQDVLDRMALDAGEVSAVLKRYGHTGTPASVAADTSADGLMIAALCDSGNGFRSAAYVLRMVNPDADEERYDALHEAADRILGNSEKGLLGTLADALSSSVATVSAYVNTDIEIPKEELLRVTTMRN